MGIVPKGRKWAEVMDSGERCWEAKDGFVRCAALARLYVESQKPLYRGMGREQRGQG
jgi:hypothetical protein